MKVAKLLQLVLNRYLNVPMLQHKVSRCRVVLEVCLLVTVCILVYIQVSSWRTERTTKVSQHHDLRNSLEYKEYHYQSGDMDSTMSRNSATSIHKYKDDRSGEEGKTLSNSGTTVQTLRCDNHSKELL